MSEEKLQLTKEAFRPLLEMRPRDLVVFSQVFLIRLGYPPTLADTTLSSIVKKLALRHGYSEADLSQIKPTTSATYEKVDRNALTVFSTYIIDELLQNYTYIAQQAGIAETVWSAEAGKRLTPDFLASEEFKSILIFTVERADQLKNQQADSLGELKLEGESGSIELRILACASGSEGVVYQAISDNIDYPIAVKFWYKPLAGSALLGYNSEIACLNLLTHSGYAPRFFAHGVRTLTQKGTFEPTLTLSPKIGKGDPGFSEVPFVISEWLPSEAYSDHFDVLGNGAILGEINAATRGEFGVNVTQRDCEIGMLRVLKTFINLSRLLGRYNFRIVDFAVIKNMKIARDLSHSRGFDFGGVKKGVHETPHEILRKFLIGVLPRKHFRDVDELIQRLDSTKLSQPTRVILREMYSKPEASLRELGDAIDQTIVFLTKRARS